jgi:ATP phosphoribosyltransferase regulatory subunit
MILATLPEAASRRRLLLPPGTDPALAAKLRDPDQGWITVAALAPAGDWHAEAVRLGCGHVLEDGKPVPARERR